jgi:hypothetical protein
MIENQLGRPLLVADALQYFPIAFKHNGNALVKKFLLFSDFIDVLDRMSHEVLAGVEQRYVLARRAFELS